LSKSVTVLVQADDVNILDVNVKVIEKNAEIILRARNKLA